ncbi:efflux RND transporter periplasmic adaptor subunit [Brevibacillus laterosporus]|uniref:Efflux RND transporter periplasmic adaptor subunit n=1 Tax=Brevibacillus halotolerans TaxID=1507437 RepID=A0ABT4HZZ9_9BACL|nr:MULTISPECIES: efflux RND transporter periplasmic adaptor subunit [Brevibacillus]MCR8986645.1 efflux RND transporter periplasmic adaptor subunit [Brevibacillus laterosporus]MCZ0832380.1 efflux RND transporter periplasmic adaptor subunit [Brevibacillus halotolerans]GIO02659.1 secretion protein HlyD [Brevibacillus halotolerans]
MNKRQKGIAGTFAIMALLLGGCSNNSDNEVANAPIVQTMKVVATTNSSGLMASGKIVPDQQVQVVSKLSGRVANVNVKEGDRVKKGTVLATLENAELVQQVRQAEAGIVASQAKLNDTKAGARQQDLDRLNSALQQAKMGWDVAQKTYDRMKALFDTGAVPQAELDKASLALEQAKSGYEQTKAQLDLAKAGATSNSITALQADVTRQKAGLDLAKTTLSNSTITSPIDGMIAIRNIEPGEMAAPSIPLMTIVNMDTVVIKASVPQEQVNHLKKGQTVQVVVNKDKKMIGTIDFISPVSDANSTTFPVKIRVKNDGSLLAGMIAEVYFGTDAQVATGVEIPKSSVIDQDGKKFVYKVDGNTVHMTPVEVTEKNSDWLYAKSGVAANDQIVTQPAKDLHDGSQVQIN